MKTGMDKRERWIDCVKGVAIFFVVMAHVNGREVFLYKWIYSFHMPIFFIIAGIVFSLKAEWQNQKTCELIKKKAVQLLYPYLTFSILTLFWTIISKGVEKSIEVLKVTILLDGYSALWFLPTLFFAEAIFIFLFKSKIHKIFVITFLFIAGFGIILFNFHGRETLNGVIYVLLNILFRSIIGSTFILIGYWIHQIFGAVQRKTLFVISAICLLVADMFLSQINGFVDLHYTNTNNLFYYYFFAVFGSYLILIIIKFGLKKNSIFEFFGRNSLIILGTHLTLPGMGIFRSLFTYIFSYFSLDTVSYAYDFFVLICTMVFETILIICINKFFPFIVKPTVPKIFMKK